MQLSSLIFLVVVVIWAAYLVQHWVRRREHLATARSVDRFSEAMRVLERRVALPASPLVSPATSYAVQRASASLRARSAASGTAASGTAASGTAASGTAASGTAASAPSGAQLAATAGAPEGPLGLAGTGGSGRPARPGRSRRQVLARKVRGIAFLVTLAAVPTTAVLSRAHVLRWVSVIISVVAFALVVVSLRLAARREQASRRAACDSASRASTAGPGRRRDASRTAEVRPAPRAARPRTSAPAAAAEGSAGADGTMSAGDPDSDPRAEAVSAGRGGPSRSPEDVPYGFAAPVAQVAAGPELPGAWSPVPVPPPTYTLKDAAPRSMAQPAGDAQRPVPIEVEDDDIERMALEHHWRAAGG